MSGKDDVIVKLERSIASYKRMDKAQRAEIQKATKREQELARRVETLESEKKNLQGRVSSATDWQNKFYALQEKVEAHNRKGVFGRMAKIDI